MLKQMCWLSLAGPDEEKVLHLRTHPSQPWQPYTCSKYAVPDYDIPGGTKGWATYQKLICSGWTLLPTDQRMQESLVQYLKSA